MNRNLGQGVLLSAATILPLMVVAHHGEHEGAFSLIEYLGRFHPVSVHFPIGFIIAAAVAEFGYLVLRRETFASAARFLVVLAALAAPVTVTLGWMAEDTMDFAAEYQPIIETHETFALIAAGLAIAAAVASELGRRRQDARFILAYRIALFAAAVAVTGAGYFGGELVYGVGHYQP
jgi:uncharacterized membrane protein